ncbi:MAG: extracellular solute-binding protein, partial [Anaerolineae bacterium]|nr:extracellular solute-binding protein [Anaerolineae bacterium]
MIQRHLRFLSLLIIVVLLAASFATTSAQDDDDLVIDFWHGLTGPDGAFLEEMVNTYNETNEDNIFVRLNVFHWDVFFDRWVASVAAGDPPDVVIYHINEMPQYAEAGVVVPIDDLAAEVGINMDEYSETVKQMSSWDGSLYGIPLDIHPIAMYYNVDMVEAAGLDPNAPPTNAEELLTWAKTLTKDGVYGISAPATNVMTFRLWWGLIFQNGGSFISDDMTEITVNSPEAAEALQFMRDLVFEHEVA